MKSSAPYSSDVAFTPVITPDLKSFIESQTSIFLATANSAGQALADRDQRIAVLEAELAQLCGAAMGRTP